MPTIDVTSILTDPAFATRNLLCQRRTQTVDNHGHAVDTVQSTPFAGVAIASSDTTIADSGRRVQGNLTLYTRFRLIDGKDGKDADLVKYKGNLYLIDNVEDFTEYGRGFVVAKGTLQPLTGGK